MKNAISAISRFWNLPRKYCVEVSCSCERWGHDTLWNAEMLLVTGTILVDSYGSTQSEAIRIAMEEFKHAHAKRRRQPAKKIIIQK